MWATTIRKLQADDVGSLQKKLTNKKKQVMQMSSDVENTKNGLVQPQIVTTWFQVASMLTVTNASKCGQITKLKSRPCRKGRPCSAANAVQKNQRKTLLGAGPKTCSGKDLEKRSARSTVARVACSPPAPPAID